MERHVMWSSWSEPGLEHLRLALRPHEIVADGLILGVENYLPFRLRYEVRCDPRWRVRKVAVNFVDDLRRITLTADGEGQWFDESGERISWLDGCLDVDIVATPFTNTLPIRRLGLKEGESANVRVPYVTMSELQVRRDDQRYTCVEATSAG